MSCLRTVWPDWAIYWTLGNFLKHLATINLPKSPKFLGNLCKDAKSLIFQGKSFLGKFYRNLAIFFWSHCLRTRINFLIFAPLLLRKSEIDREMHFRLCNFLRLWKWQKRLEVKNHDVTAPPSLLRGSFLWFIYSHSLLSTPLLQNLVGCQSIVKII